MKTNEFLTAKQCNVSRKTLYLWLKRGWIECLKEGRSVFFMGVKYINVLKCEWKKNRSKYQNEIIRRVGDFIDAVLKKEIVINVI